MPSTDRPWFLIVCDPGQDVRLARDLAERGFDIHLAMAFTRVRTANRVWVKSDPMLPPYVWVCVDFAAGQNFSIIKNTYGFSTVVSLSLDDEGRRPSEIPESVIRGMRLDEIQDIEAATRRVRRKESPFVIGMRVGVVPSHAFSKYTGTVSRVRPGSVIVDLGPQAIPMRFRDDEVMPLEQSAKRRETC